jgi:hypothetical protein
MAHRARAILTLTLTVIAAIQLIPAQEVDRDLESVLRELLPAATGEEIDALLEAGEISVPVSGDAVRLAPAFSAEIQRDNAAIEPTIGVEVLFLLPDYGISEVSPELLTRMQAISTMEGIEYYSASRERMRILFIESWAIRDPDTEERIPDPTTTSLPSSDRLYIRQRDSSFGTNVSQLDYTVTGEAIRLRMTNLDRMSYRGVIPAVGPGQLQLNLVVMPIGDTVLFYGSSAAAPLALLGMEERVGRSFTNRLIALHDWFESQDTGS